MQEFRLYKSPWKALKLLVGCAAFVAIGCLMLSRPDAPQGVAWMSIVFFGLGLLVSLFQLLDRRPQIIVNDVGVFDRMMHHEFINWEIIQDVYLAEVNKQTFICLVVDEAFEPSRRKGKFKQGMASLNKGMGFQELNISLGFVSIDAFRFAEFILAMCGAAPPERDELVRKAIANL
ncbi:STM3941 family protein [Hymenobacter sp. M29]|uniref:STM3941 family protein n=1 Tax=Hymenobacter mellowenesis TaxID=3063995 RepID=A0ABT9ACQ7_9BACT|nr:STM3941 family protein [Hymenobacter sp. M29]MDO7847144.1 STM3941 family protein [Hymenobacter sp. M29]